MAKPYWRITVRVDGVEQEVLVRASSRADAKLEAIMRRDRTRGFALVGEPQLAVGLIPDLEIR